MEAYGGSSSWSWANVIGNVLFSGIGFVAFWYGRKMKSLRSVILGLVLMIFPYFVSQTLTLYVIGAILCAVLYFWRE
ncbi:MAG: hypothetical protein A2787_01900 [Omnitrophica WOR_2 bacterium RIFCSPHIGHO2_01_FULL_48_9]|nr:MAG: hypothetical protein A3D10_06730 [Omnitrophica WOR_2 bacterium RIFCSPHIGHO2_02_FULL_48_11]OGX34489.1 MAG: hypothetical protein A2787_01900 [Omnitrophica WOR_2 bacterium RIFCSPHIGHO2_01_FULL_48_9]